jgi:hypothetical protein
MLNLKGKNFLVNSEGQNNFGHKNMNTQTCDKGSNHYLDMKAEERLGFRYIKRIFDCFVKHRSCKACEDDMDCMPVLFSLLYVDIWAEEDVWSISNGIGVRKLL